MHFNVCFYYFFYFSTIFYCFIVSTVCCLYASVYILLASVVTILEFLQTSLLDTVWLYSQVSGLTVYSKVCLSTRHVQISLHHCIFCISQTKTIHHDWMRIIQSKYHIGLILHRTDLRLFKWQASRGSKVTEDHILILNLKGDMGKRSVETNRMLFQYFSQLTLNYFLWNVHLCFFSQVW